ncbi:MAG: phage tail terminator-like protein [Candidatus Kapaibacterium sp.]|jgi:hypothetical protein
MSLAKIRAALESRLNGMASALPTAWENLAYTPTRGEPWQRVRLMLNEPIDHTISSDVVEQRGLLEVLLFYPQGDGPAAAQAQAALVAARFAPVQTLTASGTRVLLTQTPAIGTAWVDEAWYVLPVTVRWRSLP